MIVTPMAKMITILNAISVAELDASTIGLFQNNYVPVIGSTLANFTASTFVGYAPITLGFWAGAFDNGLSEAETNHPLLTWLCTGGLGQDIYGYYVHFGGVLIYAERDPFGPFGIAPGITYSVLPRYTVRNQP